MRQDIVRTNSHVNAVIHVVRVLLLDCVAVQYCCLQLLCQMWSLGRRGTKVSRILRTSSVESSDPTLQTMLYD